MKIKKINDKHTGTTGVLAILLGLLAGALLMLVTGDNPFFGYVYLFQGGLKSLERLGNTLSTAGPLILSGLAVAFAFRTGMFNIGVSGQMLMGGFFATAMALTLDLPRPLIIPICLLAAIVGGGLCAGIPGFLKARFNVHEVVSTIMMNHISLWIVYYAIPFGFKDEFLETESRRIPAAASLRDDFLSSLFQGSWINWGVLVAIIALIIVSIIINKTVLGFELKAVGFSPSAAEYAGISVKRNVIISMVISGALAGLAGAVLYLGNANKIEIGILPSQGYDGIAVALLGANTPIGVFAAGLFFGLLHSGKGFMTAMTNIPPQIGDTIIAVIIYLAATSALLEQWIGHFYSWPVFIKFQDWFKKLFTKNKNQEGGDDVDNN